MLKSQLIQHLIKKFRFLTDRDVERSVDSVLERMVHALQNGDRIEIRDFGSFSLHYRPPRRAHNPKTGLRTVTEPKYVPHFKPGREMRERVDASNKPLKDDDEV